MIRCAQQGPNPVPTGICVLVLTLIFGLAPAFGQSRDRPFPILREGRVWGPFLVERGFSIDNFGYEDNIFRSNINQVDDYRIALGPNLRGQLQLGPNAAFTFADKMTFEAFLENSFLNNIDNTLDTQLDVLLGPFLLTTKGGWYTSRGRPNSEIDERPRLDRTLLEQTLTVFLGPRTDVRLTYAESELDFSDRDPFSVIIDPDGDGQGTPVSLGEALNREESTWIGEVGWRFGGGTRVLARHVAKDSVFGSEFVARNIDESRTLVGFEFSPDAVLSGRLLVGRAELVNENPTNDSIPFDGTISDVLLTIKPTTSFRIRASVKDDVVFSTYDQNLYYESRLTQLSSQFFLRSGWGFQTRLSRENVDYPAENTFSPPVGERRKDQINTAFGGLLFRTRSGLQLGLGYGIRERDSNSPSVIDEERFLSTTGSFAF